MESCTRKIAISRFHTFGGNSPDVVLVDTPGFDHEHMTDAEVLRVIAEWLWATYVLSTHEDNFHSVRAFQL